MYGIYINVFIQQTAANTKPQINTDTYHALVKLELEILDAYVKTKKHVQTNVTYKLAELLKTKFQINNLQNEKTNCLKISGIWENNQTKELGISFKF
jgi:hypothetical protein